MRPGSREEADEDMSEVRQGLNLLGFNTDLVDWLLSSNLDVTKELNEVRRAVRLYGKGQHQVQQSILSNTGLPILLWVWQVRQVR